MHGSIQQTDYNNSDFIFHEKNDLVLFGKGKGTIFAGKGIVPFMIIWRKSELGERKKGTLLAETGYALRRTVKSVVDGPQSLPIGYCL